MRPTTVTRLTHALVVATPLLLSNVPAAQGDTAAMLRDLGSIAPRTSSAVMIARGPFHLRPQLASCARRDRSTGDTLRSLVLGLECDVLQRASSALGPQVREAAAAHSGLHDAPGSLDGLHAIAFGKRWKGDAASFLRTLPEARLLARSAGQLAVAARPRRQRGWSWTQYYALPRPNLLLTSTRLDLLEESAALALSPRGDLELPRSLQGCLSKVDTTADVWGVHIPSGADLLWSSTPPSDRPDSLVVEWRDGARARIGCEGHTGLFGDRVQAACRRWALACEQPAFGLVWLTQRNGLSSHDLLDSVGASMGYDEQP